MAIRPQPISGVSVDRETIMMTVYPSVAATAVGRLLGSLYDSIPVRVFGMRLSRLLFPLPTAPVALLIYLLQKIAGVRYVLTNRSLQVWKSLGSTLIREVSLSDVAEIDIHQLPGQEFYRAGDLVMLSAGGDPLLTLGGIPQPDVFRRTILEARDAGRQVAASLAAIQARQSA